MKKIYLILIALFVLFGIIISFEFIFADTNFNAKSENIVINNVIIDKSYLLALNAADQFLCSWLMRDQKKGIEFITDNLKNSLDSNELFAFFVSTSNPHHQGFEILGYKHITDEKIRFLVWLYEDYTAQEVKQYKRPTPYYIDVVKFTQYIWKVDSLPSAIRF